MKYNAGSEEASKAITQTGSTTSEISTINDISNIDMQPIITEEGTIKVYVKTSETIMTGTKDYKRRYFNER